MIAVLYGSNWSNAADDEAVYEFIQFAIDTLDAKAKRAGLYYDHIYVNDAAPTQVGHVFQRYDEGRSLPKMRRIARKYGWCSTASCFTCTDSQ